MKHVLCLGDAKIACQLKSMLYTYFILAYYDLVPLILKVYTHAKWVPTVKLSMLTQ